MGAHPSDGALAVLDLRGERGDIGEPVVDGRAEVALLHERDEPDNAHLLVAALPRAAVDEDDHRHRVLGQGLRADDVQLQGYVAALAVFHVADDLDVGWYQGLQTVPERPLLGQDSTAQRRDAEQRDD
jgi:hypothetical protein